MNHLINKHIITLKNGSEVIGYEYARVLDYKSAKGDEVPHVLYSDGFKVLYPLRDSQGIGTDKYVSVWLDTDDIRKLYKLIEEIDSKPQINLSYDPTLPF